jgi:peptidoglycan hydrolase-like protein with peptidoglycan-binding domain
VQTRLAREGYYYGAIDGIMGRRTRAAIRAYERTHNLPVDGVITQELLGTMRLRY